MSEPSNYEKLYRERESNPHGDFSPEDFKSANGNDLPRPSLSAVSANGGKPPRDTHSNAHTAGRS